jgi:hypothetical protein
VSELGSRRSAISKTGYVLVAAASALSITKWSRTCGLGGFHCFNERIGNVMLAAQWCVIVGSISSAFGRGTLRLVFVLGGLFELGCCYFALLVH